MIYTYKVRVTTSISQLASSTSLPIETYKSLTFLSDNEVIERFHRRGAVAVFILERPDFDDIKGTSEWGCNGYLGKRL